VPDKHSAYDQMLNSSANFAEFFAELRAERTPNCLCCPLYSIDNKRTLRPMTALLTELFWVRAAKSITPPLSARQANVELTLSRTASPRAGFRYRIVLSRFVWPSHDCTVRRHAHACPRDRCNRCSRCPWGSGLLCRPSIPSRA